MVFSSTEMHNVLQKNMRCAHGTKDFNRSGISNNVQNMGISYPITSYMLLEAFNETRGWKSQTISTFLSRLVDKEYLSVKKIGSTNEYRAIISAEEYAQRSAREMINKIHGGSVKRLITSFVESDAISEKELEDIKKWFSER